MANAVVSAADEVDTASATDAVSLTTGGRAAAALLRRDASAQQLVTLARTVERARDYIKESKAPNTRRAYAADWRDFRAWCVLHGRPSLPASPDTVALYLSDLAERCKTSTLQRRLAALSQAHQAAGQTAHDVPTKHATVRAVMSGIRRTKGTAQRGKAAAVTAVVRAMVEGTPDRLLGLRDRALLLLGFSGAFRRSELVALDVEDLEFTGEGLVVTQRRGKTDQEGEGRKVGIPFGRASGGTDTCPVRAVRTWLDAAAVLSGPVFRSVNRHGHVQPGRLSDKAVALVVKRHAPAAGLDPLRYAGHSLRAGLATAAAAAGASERSIMNQTGHRSVPMVRKYIRDGQLFRENAASTVGL